MQYRAIITGHRAVNGTQLMCHLQQTPPEAPEEPAPAPAIPAGRAGHPGRAGCPYSGAASPLGCFCHVLRGDNSSLDSWSHLMVRDCKAALGISICVIAGRESSFQSGPCPCLCLLRAWRLLLGTAPAAGNGIACTGIVFSTHSIASYFDSRSCLCDREERPPFPFKGYPHFVGRLLGAKADLMESRPRAAPLIREVLPDSFSKDFPRKLDALAAIWTSHTRGFTGSGGTGPADGRSWSFLVLLHNSLQMIQFCL